ncbi:MAG: hypothetical protein ACOXZK_07290 [Bacteroidales bacterium]|jgi:tetratricopeptide (TPR) repeat protein|nr:DUF1573 domain-containing protein [Bacteroidales bacterium]
MKKNRNRLLSKSFHYIYVVNIFLFLIFSLDIVAQDAQSLTYKAGYEAFSVGDYQEAAICFAQLVNETNGKNAKYLYYYSHSLEKSFAYQEAAKWYEVLYKIDSLKTYPETKFHWAQMVKQLGDYEKASRLFREFQNEYKAEDSYYLERTKIEISACHEAQIMMKRPLDVKIEHLSKNINTPYSEFNAHQLGDTALYFSSLRLLIPDNENSIFPSLYISKIYYSRMSMAGYSAPKELPISINNPETHNANFCFSPDKTRMYFTRCKTQSKSKLNCEIWLSEMRHGRWRKPQKLNRRINAPGSTTTQPFIVEHNDHEVLYFVSDRAGGYGGMDIWYSVYEGGKYYDPVNLGSNINTPGNEITPFYDFQKSTLYFSSDWHPGMGGYDIFFSEGGLNQWGLVHNVGYPLNSPANDLYFSVIEEDSLAGYFTSNRKGSYFLSGETCCNDLYYFEYNSAEKPQSIALVDTLFVEYVDMSSKIKELLPLTLYFHNDEPDPATTKTVTDKNYKNTLADYFAMKDIYKKEYSKGLSAQDAQVAEQDIENFFDEFVGKGFSDLEKFALWLKEDLDRGISAKITIRGYTSPLHTADYNMKLAMRRISSLKNYIHEYENGLFMPYINEERGKPSLKLLDAPIGKELASPLVSDNPNDKRNSIYSRAAALERRIQIVMYETEEETMSKDRSPKILLAQKEIDFGKLKNNQINTLVVQFMNIGEELLEVKEVVSQHPAFKIVYTPQQLQNMQKGEFSLILMSQFVEELLDEEIIIRSNAQTPEIKIRVKASREL